MPDPRWRKVWRDAMAHKARTALVVLAIAIGLAGAGTILDAWALVDRVTHESYLASHPVSATLRVDSVDASVLSAARGVRGVQAARARRSVMVALRARAGWQSALLSAYDDYAAREIGTLRPTTGAWPPPDGGIVVEHSSVELSGVTVGEAANVIGAGSAERSVAIAGIVRDVSVAPGWMEHVVYGYVTPATLRQLGLASSFNDVELLAADRRANQEEVRRLAYEVKAAIERTGHRVRDVEVPVPGEHIHAAQMNSLLYTQGAFGLLALLVCGFLVVNLVSAMLASQVREIGVMKTIGARPSQLARMYLAYAAALGLVASAIAVPVAMALGRMYGALKAELLNFDVTGYAIPWWAIALQVVVGIGVPVIAAAFPVRRGCNAPVATALRDFGLDRDVVPAEDWTRHIGWLPRPMLLSIRNAFRKRQRMTLTLLALAMGGSVFLGATNLRQSVLGAVDLLYAPRKYDFAIRLGDAHPIDSIEAIASSVPGVRRAEAWGGARATMVHDGGMPGNAFAISAPPAATSLLAPRMDGGRWLRAGDAREMVISRRLATLAPAMTIGSRVTIEIGATRTEMTVIGMIDDGPAPSAYVARETLAAITGQSRTTALVVASTVAGLGAQVDLIQRVRGALERRGLAVASSQLLEENRRVMEDHLLVVVQFLGVMGWVMIAVGGMGLASTMSLAVMERTREIGVMRAIGARHSAVIAMVEGEGLVIALASWVGAVILAAPVSVALAKVFSRVMIEVAPVYWDARGVVLWLGLVVAVAAVASAWPAVKAVRGTIGRALSYE